MRNLPFSLRHITLLASFTIPTTLNHLISKLTHKFSKSRVGKKFKKTEFKVIAGIRLQLCDLFDELFQKSFLSELHDSSYLQQLHALFQVVLQFFQMHHVLLSVIKGAQQLLAPVSFVPIISGTVMFQ